MLAVSATSANSVVSEEDQILYLFDACKTNKNEKWLQHVTNLESDWSRETLTTAEDLMKKAGTHADAMVRNKEWKPPAKEQLTALNAERSSNRRTSGNNNRSNSNSNSNSGGSRSSRSDNRTPEWKYDRGQSSSTKLTKNGKECHWCTGPGHNGKAMWVIHKAGSCGNGSSDSNSGNSGSTNEAHSAQGRRSSRSKNSGNNRNGGNSRASRSDFKANVAQILDAQGGGFGDDCSDLVDKLAAAACD